MTKEIVNICIDSGITGQMQREIKDHISSDHRVTVYSDLFDRRLGVGIENDDEGDTDRLILAAYMAVMGALRRHLDVDYTDGKEPIDVTKPLADNFDAEDL